MLLWMPKSALLYTLDKTIKSIILNGNKACISNDSFTIVGCMFYHMIEDLGSFSKVCGLGFNSRVQGLGS